MGAKTEIDQSPSIKLVTAIPDAPPASWQEAESELEWLIVVSIAHPLSRLKDRLEVGARTPMKCTPTCFSSGDHILHCVVDEK
jgi:hypothetical protein